VSTEQNNNYNYTPPPVYYQPVPPPQPEKKGHGCGGCLTGLGVLIVALTIAFLTIFFVVKPQIDQMIYDMGATNIKQIFTLYKEVTTRVDEKEIVTHGFTNEDYLTAKTKLINNNFDIFDEEGNISPSKFANARLSDDIEMTDKQLVALLNNALEDFLAQGNIPIFKKLKLIGTAKQVKITSALSQNKFKITTICSINTDDLTSQMGILGGLIPQSLYLTSTATYSIVDGKLTYSDSFLKLNKIKDTSFQELLNIVNKSVIEGKDELLLQDLSNAVAELLCDGFNALQDNSNILINLVDEGIRISPNPDAPPVDSSGNEETETPTQGENAGENKDANTQTKNDETNNQPEVSDKTESTEPASENKNNE